MEKILKKSSGKEKIMYIYYDSKTGNVKRFVEKMRNLRPDWNYVKIDPYLKIENKGHFLTYTTKIGQIPETTVSFLENESNRKYLKSVSSSGNRNWGEHFAEAANKIENEYGIPLLMKFELSGTNTEVENYIEYLCNSCMGQE